MVEEFTLSDPENPKADPSQPSSSPNPPRPSNVKRGLDYTPMVDKQSASACFTSGAEERDPRLILMGSEVTGKIIGPMPANDFLEEFLPAPRTKLQSLQTYQIETRKVAKSKEEKDMYDPFVKAVQSLCRNFTIVATQDRPFLVFHKVTIKPDVCLFPSNDAGDISKVELMIEAKFPKTSDPFTDMPGKPLVNDSNAAKETLGQITTYASAHQAAQFRSHAFSLLLFPKYARILRWDRSGVIVTEQIPLSSTDLPEFFHRFDCMTADKRGIDVSVTKPSKPNELHAREALGFDEDVRLVQLPVADSGYIVPRDIYIGGTRSPLGRSTRAFFAYSLLLKKAVFLKDTWRLQSQTAEHDLYAKLKEHKVPYIATVLAAGDVPNQQTVTQDFVKKKATWAKNRPEKLRKHFHYRLVLEEIGTPLTTFSSTRMLVKVMHDALIAHKVAYEQAKILHRDISPNNILIYNGSALLIDWDLSKSQENIQHARESERTGTWQFTAARLLDPETAGPQTLTDDIESFIHVLTWTAFRYADHQWTKEKLTCFLQSIFDYSFTDAQGQRDNGDAKSRYLLAPIDLKRARFKCTNLVELLRSITSKIATRYEDPPSAIAQEWNNKLVKSQPNDETPDENGTKVRKMVQGVMQKDYEKRLVELESSDWIIETFAAALERDNWPENDAAREHELHNIPSVLKTSNQDPSLQVVRFVKNDETSGSEEKPELNGPPTKKPRLDTARGS